MMGGFGTYIWFMADTTDNADMRSLSCSQQFDMFSRVLAATNSSLRKQTDDEHLDK